MARSQGLGSFPGIENRLKTQHVIPRGTAVEVAELNEVVINQVLVSFGDAAVTREVIRRIQEEGACWCEVTEWKGKTAMRISVLSWATTGEDVDRSLEAMVRIARGVRG